MCRTLVINPCIVVHRVFGWAYCIFHNTIHVSGWWIRACAVGIFPVIPPFIIIHFQFSGVVMFVSSRGFYRRYFNGDIRPRLSFFFVNIVCVMIGIMAIFGGFISGRWSEFENFKKICHFKMKWFWKCDVTWFWIIWIRFFVFWLDNLISDKNWENVDNDMGEFYNFLKKGLLKGPEI